MSVDCWRVRESSVDLMMPLSWFKNVSFVALEAIAASKLSVMLLINVT